MRFVILVNVAIVATSAAQAETTSRVVRTYDAPEATQAVAVDGEHFYAIANYVIAKYRRATGERVARWVSSEETPLKHLNSGWIADGRLYCAHSNFPEYPNTSSVEVFDTATMKHVDSHSLGIYEGSLTWVQKRDGHWWAVFAHYTEKVNDDPFAKDNSYTSLVRFDEDWHREAGWVFPKPVLKRFGKHSCSGGFWSADGKLYCSGHDEAEVYELALPKSGATLRLVQTIPVGITGQGIALDPTDPHLIWGISRAKRQVTVSRLEPTEN